MSWGIAAAALTRPGVRFTSVTQEELAQAYDGLAHELADRSVMEFLNGQDLDSNDGVNAVHLEEAANDLAGTSSVGEEIYERDVEQLEQGNLVAEIPGTPGVTYGDLSKHLPKP